LDLGRLFGSRIIVANVELRFPLLRLLGLGKGYFGAWPLEFYGFYDAGLAWASEPNSWWGGFDAGGNPDPKLVRPFFAGGDRKPLTSTGIGLRTNLFGMLVLGINYVYPFQDKGVGWHFQFYISPGF
jgi:outer membrane protein assembly factor BamA